MKLGELLSKTVKEDLKIMTTKRPKQGKGLCFAESCMRKSCLGCEYYLGSKK